MVNEQTENEIPDAGDTTEFQMPDSDDQETLRHEFEGTEPGGKDPQSNPEHSPEKSEETNDGEKYISVVAEKFGENTADLTYRSNSGVDTVGKIGTDGELWYLNPVSGIYESSAEAWGEDNREQYENQKKELFENHTSILPYFNALEQKMQYLVQELEGENIKSYLIEREPKKVDEQREDNTTQGSELRQSQHEKTAGSSGQTSSGIVLEIKFPSVEKSSLSLSQENGQATAEPLEKNLPDQSLINSISKATANAPFFSLPRSEDVYHTIQEPSSLPQNLTLEKETKEPTTQRDVFSVNLILPPSQAFEQLPNDQKIENQGTLELKDISLSQDKIQEIQDSILLFPESLKTFTETAPVAVLLPAELSTGAEQPAAIELATIANTVSTPIFKEQANDPIDEFILENTSKSENRPSEDFLIDSALPNTSQQKSFQNTVFVSVPLQKNEVSTTHAESEFTPLSIAIEKPIEQVAEQKPEPVKVAELASPDAASVAPASLLPDIAPSLSSEDLRTTADTVSSDGINTEEAAAVSNPSFSDSEKIIAQTTQPEFNVQLETDTIAELASADSKDLSSQQEIAPQEILTPPTADALPWGNILSAEKFIEPLAKESMPNTHETIVIPQQKQSERNLSKFIPHDELFHTTPEDFNLEAKEYTVNEKTSAATPTLQSLTQVVTILQQYQRADNMIDRVVTNSLVTPDRKFTDGQSLPAKNISTIRNLTEGKGNPQPVSATQERDTSTTIQLLNNLLRSTQLQKTIANSSSLHSDVSAHTELQTATQSAIPYSVSDDTAAGTNNFTQPLQKQAA